MPPKPHPHNRRMKGCQWVRGKELYQLAQDQAIASGPEDAGGQAALPFDAGFFVPAVEHTFQHSDLQWVQVERERSARGSNFYKSSPLL